MVSGEILPEARYTKQELHCRWLEQLDKVTKMTGYLSLGFMATDNIVCYLGANKKCTITSCVVFLFFPNTPITKVSIKNTLCCNKLRRKRWRWAHCGDFISRAEAPDMCDIPDPILGQPPLVFSFITVFPQPCRSLVQLYFSICCGSHPQMVSIKLICEFRLPERAENRRNL